jgi:hypothetical protein
MAGETGLADGVVRVRFSGAAGDIDAAAALAGQDGIELIERSAPYPNRRDPGHRVYLTVRVRRMAGGAR